MVLVLALVTTAVTVGVRRAAHRGVPLDPGNPGREGAQAVASVLHQRGVGVTVVRGQDDLLGREAPGRDTTVVVTGTGQLSDQTARTMLDRVRGARRLVLVEPPGFLLRALHLPVDVSSADSPGPSVRAGCSVDGIRPSDTITTGGRLYEAQSQGATVGTAGFHSTARDDVTECFGQHGSALVVVAAQPHESRPEIAVLGTGLLLRNGDITQLDNAGVAVRLLARGERLEWYLPSALDISTGDTTPTSQVPAAVGPLAVLLLLGLLALMVWRGRRFGPLVAEPLPAVVKAIETTQSRGRLYRKARDTGRAGQALRARACRRLGGYLGLPPSATPAAVAAAVATAAARDPVAVAAVLAGPPAPDETALLTLAHDLSDLEKEVRRP